LTVAGRTDAGVHATGQVAHVDLPAWRGDPALISLAAVLPLDVRVPAARVVPAAFDARFAALWRRYEYRICDRIAGADPLRRRFVLDRRRRTALDASSMQHAAHQLVGLHDFAAFCRARATGTTIRTLQQLDVGRDASGEVVVRVQADAFCHSMVRSLVGALLAVGEGRRDVAWPASLLALRSRSSEVVVAPAHGLTLVAVGYPPDDLLAAQAERARARRDGIPAAASPDASE
jgi:tRNA pseudouridine38-40 synthase